MSKSLGEVANYKPVSRLGMEELAYRQIGIVPSGGVIFARKGGGEEKDIARSRVAELFHPDRWPSNLRILTMPGLHWRFERDVLGMREDGWHRKMRKGPSRTHFTCVENDRSIYFASVTQMPGMYTDNALKQSMLPFAEMGVKTKFSTFYFANADDFLGFEWSHPWGAAWLDYTGPLSVARLAKIQQFYERHIEGILIVTALKARWNRPTVSAINRAGGHSEWLHQNLAGTVLHDIEYFDTSPMAQFAVSKLAMLESIKEVA